jgi:glucose/arabinose dehydrogenase
MGSRWFVLSLVVFLSTGCWAGVSSAPPAVSTSDTAAAADLIGSAPAVRVTGTVATGLQVPWGIAWLPDGSALVSERDSARVLRVGSGSPSPVGAVEGVVARGEGGLLGIAYSPGWLYAYFTGADDNRVVRMAWDGTTLGTQQEILTAIPKSGIHNGGRIMFGPDGLLYIATGDAGSGDHAQDPASLAGKILRVTPEGSVPRDNPLAGSPVFSLGHRNVQGLAFDSRGRLWASEFGQSDVDELNLIVAGSNYGWPDCEGACGRAPYVDPVVEWEPTSVASPSGLAIIGDYAYVASLRGETVWQVPLSESGANGRESSIPLALGDLGRLRTIAVTPEGGLWLSTSNTDGRGDPRAGDDQILALTVS